jgi:hypothetical protein
LSHVKDEREGKKRIKEEDKIKKKKVEGQRETFRNNVLPSFSG